MMLGLFRFKIVTLHNLDLFGNVLKFPCIVNPFIFPYIKEIKMFEAVSNDLIKINIFINLGLTHSYKLMHLL